jgi:hypothetical protein
MPNLLPLFRHPTLTVLFDEDGALLRDLDAHLAPALTRRCFSDPQSAVEWIERMQAAFMEAQPAIQSAWQRALPVEAAAEAIYRYVEDPRRFFAPSVIVTEYSAEAPGSMVFCEAVAHLPSKVVGIAAGAELARYAGAVDHIVPRDAAGALDRLEDEIERSKMEYFLMLTSQTPVLRPGPDAYGFLRDEAVATLVGELSDRYGFVEYYLFMRPAGLLFFDAAANPALLVVLTEEDMSAQFESARAGAAPAELLLDLFECRVVPFFHTVDGMYPRGAKVDPYRYCKPAEVCVGARAYYWALFDLPEGYRRGVPFSHARFLRQGAVGEVG